MCNLQVELLTAARAFSCCKKDPALSNSISCCSCMNWESFAYTQTAPRTWNNSRVSYNRAWKKKETGKWQLQGTSAMPLHLRGGSCLCHFVSLCREAVKAYRAKTALNTLYLQGVWSEEQKTWIREHCKGCCNHICSLDAASSQVNSTKSFCSTLEMRKAKVWVPTDLLLTLVRVRNMMMEKEHLIHHICSLRG